MKMTIDSKLKTGVYKITNIITGEFYIGSTTGTFKKRKNGHERLLIANKHHSKLLQKDWNDLGSAAFEFSVVDLCELDVTFSQEQHYMDLLSPKYNVLKFAGGGILGYKHTDESKLKMSNSRRGKKYVFYKITDGIVIMDQTDFSRTHSVIYPAVIKLTTHKLLSYNGWICLGIFDGSKNYSDGLDEIYRKKLARLCDYYAFYKSDNEKFTGTVGEFTRKFKYSRDDIKGIVNNTRYSSDGWICLGKCTESYEFPTDVVEIYNKRISKNRRSHPLKNKIFTFSSKTDMFVGTIDAFCTKFGHTKQSIYRLWSGKKKNYKTWTVQQKNE